MPSFRLTDACVAALWFAAGSPALAQQAPVRPALNENIAPRVIEDRLRLEIGAFGSSLDTLLRIDPSASQQGTEVSAEGDLGLADFRALPQLELTLLPGDRHFIRIGSLSVRRSAQTRLTRNIVFDDDVYLANERVDGTLNIALFGLTYGYQFLKNDAFDLAATFGIQIAEFEANAIVTNRVLRDPESGVAPVPLLGVEGRTFLGEHWSIEGRLQYLSLHVSDVSGSILDVRLSALWHFNPHLAAGLGFRHFNVDVDSRDAGTPGLVNLSMSGPLLFMQASL